MLVLGCGLPDGTGGRWARAVLGRRWRNLAAVAAAESRRRRRIYYGGGGLASAGRETERRAVE
jgi:hypothetical protein